MSGEMQFEHGSKGRGRSGDFDPTRAKFSWTEDKKLQLEVFSRRKGKAPPIRIKMSRRDGLALLDALSEIMGLGRRT